jgi:hypothetical protein
MPGRRKTAKRLPGGTRKAAEILKAIREHERACQWSCERCRAKLARQEEAARRQRDAESAVRAIIAASQEGS